MPLRDALVLQKSCQNFASRTLFAAWKGQEDLVGAVEDCWLLPVDGNGARTDMVSEYGSTFAVLTELDTVPSKTSALGVRDGMEERFSIVAP